MSKTNLSWIDNSLSFDSGQLEKNWFRADRPVRPIAETEVDAALEPCQRPFFEVPLKR
jgi:hypothetical protein